MPKFRKKPIVVEAEQYRVASMIPDGVTREIGDGVRDYVTTAHGQRAYLADGDWIIKEPDGRGHYPCKPDIFAATYEPVESL